MLQGPRFARVSYALFAVAVLAALLKIGGMSGAKPVLLQNTPPKPAIAETPAPLEKDIPTEPLLDLPEPGDEAAQSAPVEGTRAERAPAGPGAPPEVRGGFVDDLSVFRRPKKDGAPPEPVCGDLGDVPESSRAVFPLPRDYFGSYEPGWGSPRPQGAHEGTDLMSPVGTPEFAITDGTVVEVAGANGSGWNRLGGYTVMIRAAHDVGPIREGDLFYYAHMDEASVLPVGTKVRAGQRVGSAGDTGEGPEVTRGNFPPHLHLGWYDAGEAGGDRSKVESGAMDPYPLLLWLERNGGAVSGGTDASSYCEAPQGPAPTPASPGETPDLDTGSNDARPTPATEKGDERDPDRPPNRDDEPANDEDESERPDDAPDPTTPPPEGGDGEDSEGEAPPPPPQPPVQNEPGDATGDGPDTPQAGGPDLPEEEAPRGLPRVGEPERPTIPDPDNRDPDDPPPEKKKETGPGPSEDPDRPDAEDPDQPAPKAGQTDNRKRRLRP